MDYQTLPKKLTTSSPRTIYDGVFSSSSSGSQPPNLSSPAPRGVVVDDYREIFRGSGNDSSSSSIPFLDVPELFNDRKTTSVDLTTKNSNSCVDYSKVFGGFGDFDGALSYEDIVAAKPSKKKHTSTYGFVSMELEPMNTASMASHLGGSVHSDSLGGNQMKSHEESYQSFVGTKQFNMPYRKTSPGLSNGANATHIAELNAVSGYTYLVDGGSLKPIITGDKPVSSDAENGFRDSGSIRHMGNSNLSRKDMSRLPRVDGSEVPSGSSVKFQNNISKNRYSSNESLFDANDVNSKENLHKESPSNLQPELGIGRDDFKKSTIPKHGMPRTSGYKKTKGMFSPPDLDEEMDENSIAAASAAAVKLAIAKAQARIKIAKESKEKKVGLQSSVKPSFKDALISDEINGTRVANKANWSSENKAQQISAKADSWMQGSTGLGNQATTKARQVGPGFSDSLKVPDMEGSTREAPVQRIRSTPIEHWRCSTDEQKAERLYELSSVRFEQADNAKGMVQSSNESISKEVKLTEKKTDRPVEYGKNSKLIDKVCTVDKHESEHNVFEKAIGPGFGDSLKLPDVEESTREEAHVQRIRSPPLDHSQCRTEEREAEKLSELSSAQFEEADNATRMMQSSNGSIRKEVKMTEKQMEDKPVEYGNKLTNKLCTDEKSENEQNIFDKAEAHQLHDYKLNTSIEQINVENQNMTVGVTTEQEEETAKKQPETPLEEECCEKIHMLNQQIKIEKKDEHKEVKGVEHTEVTEALEQSESKKGEEVAFEQVESKNYLDYVANREEREMVLKQTCGLDSWKEIVEGPYLRKSETPLIFEEKGENNHIDAQWRSDGMKKLDLVHRQQIMAVQDGEVHDMEQIENIWPVAHAEFTEDKTCEEEKENGSLLQQICQLKDNLKTEAATRRWVETDRTQADLNFKSGDEATEEACLYECKQDYGENSSWVQEAAQSRVEADGIHADVDLKSGDEATQEVCSDQQNEQERYEGESEHNHYEIEESYMQTEAEEHVEVVPEVLKRENDGTVKEVSETSDEPMMKRNETKPAEQIIEPEEELEPKRSGSVYSATEFKEQMNDISETELGQRQQKQCKEDIAISIMCCESGKTNGSDEDVQVSFGKEEQSLSEERSVDQGQCMKATQVPCMSKEKWEATKTNEEINCSEIEEKIKENNKILEETEHACQKEMELEKRRPTEKDEAKKICREKEKQRIAVERAMREARERAFAEARRKIMSEAQERVEKIPARTNERLSADKATTEAKLKAERAAVERATAEARERALKKALSEKAGMGVRKQTNINEMRRTFSSTDSQHNGSVLSSSSNYPDPSNYGVPSSSERMDGVNGESAERCKARLERHQRTVERAAKALAEKNMRDLLAQKEQQERNRLAEALDADIKRWSSGKEKNLRALLSTLQYILGSDGGWQPISLTDLVTSAAVKKAYRKATLFVHPDKLQQRGASIQQKYICEKVFDLLKEAWNRFSAEER